MFYIPTLIAFFYEAFLAIPFLGGFVALATGLGTVTVAFFIHAIVLAFRFGTGDSKVTPLIALFLTLFTFIPGIAWLMHVIITILYFIDFFVGKKNR